MYKLKKGILPVNFNPYFTSTNKSHNHSTRFSETNNFFPRVNSLYGSKSGVGKLWPVGHFQNFVSTYLIY